MFVVRFARGISKIRSRRRFAYIYVGMPTLILVYVSSPFVFRVQTAEFYILSAKLMCAGRMLRPVKADWSRAVGLIMQEGNNNFAGWAMLVGPPGEIHQQADKM